MMFFFSAKNADSILENALKHNPYYPFEKIQNKGSVTPVYVFSLRYKQFYLSLLLVGISGTFTVLWPVIGNNTQYCMFSAFLLVLSGFHALEYHPTRTIVYDPSAKYFTVYRGTKVICCRHVSDLFIRMVAKDVGNKGIKYHLAVDGSGIELPMPLPGESVNKKKLRSLAHKLANNLNVNYFDVNNVSRHHLINQEKSVTATRREE